MNSEDIESLLECSICLEQLDNTHKVLPCQHTFCRQCLDGVIRKSRKGSYLCPECRSESSTPLDDLPSNIILNRILDSLGKKSSSSCSNSSATPPTTPEALPTLPPKPVLHRTQQVYRALYDYKPCQNDELELKKSELYIVIEKRKDAWYKGYSIQSPKTGFFPGNYVQHVKKEVRPPVDSSSISSMRPKEDIDLIDLRSGDETPAKGRHRQPPFRPMDPTQQTNIVSPHSMTSPPSSFIRIPPPPRHSGASSAILREKYKCVVPFPASGKYELNMEEGDIVYLISKRDDGWCKGTLERTGQVGLFPYSFVKAANTN